MVTAEDLKEIEDILHCYIEQTDDRTFHNTVTDNGFKVIGAKDLYERICRRFDKSSTCVK